MKLSLRQFRRNILRDTIEHYNLTNRSESKGGCKYQLDPDSENVCCAVGRLLPRQLRIHLDTYGNTSVDNEEIFDQLPEGIKALGMNFLKAIQILHDRSRHWTKEGASQEGLYEARQIRKDYKL